MPNVGLQKHAKDSLLLKMKNEILSKRHILKEKRNDCLILLLLSHFLIFSLILDISSLLHCHMCAYVLPEVAFSLSFIYNAVLRGIVLRSACTKI